MGHKINHCDSNGTYEDERCFRVRRRILCHQQTSTRCRNRDRLAFNHAVERQLTSKSVVFLVSWLIGRRSDNDPVKMYVRELASVEPLTREEAHLFQEMGKQRTGRDVRKVVARKQYTSSSLSMLDLIQEVLDSLPTARLHRGSTRSAPCEGGNSQRLPIPASAGPLAHGPEARFQSEPQSARHL